MNREFILCSAIKRNEPKNIEDSCYFKKDQDIFKIELGWRHCDIFLRFPGEVSKDPHEQGFFTSKGRFVNRKEAAIIALKAGQITKISRKLGLLSEDLY